MKNPHLSLEHIRQAMRFILDHAKSKKDLLRDPVLRFAVERNLAVIGEAAKRLPEAFRKRHTNVPWKEMAGMRDLMIHQYDGIDIDEVWSAIEKDMPDVLDAIDQMLQK